MFTCYWLTYPDKKFWCYISYSHKTRGYIKMDLCQRSSILMEFCVVGSIHNPSLQSYNKPSFLIQLIIILYSSAHKLNSTLWHALCSPVYEKKHDVSLTFKRIYFMTCFLICLTCNWLNELVILHCKNRFVKLTKLSGSVNESQTKILFCHLENVLCWFNTYVLI